jgi:hypothetical protein
LAETNLSSAVVMQAASDQVLIHYSELPALNELAGDMLGAFDIKWVTSE